MIHFHTSLATPCFVLPNFLVVLKLWLWLRLGLGCDNNDNYYFLSVGTVCPPIATNDPNTNADRLESLNPNTGESLLRSIKSNIFHTEFSKLFYYLTNFEKEFNLDPCTGEELYPVPKCEE